MKIWNAYHFVSDTLRDGSPVPENGAILKFEGKLEMCRSGFHASPKAWQALPYAPGETLCRVYSGGELIKVNDKWVSSERTVISRIDATDLLRKHARMCALDVIHLWDAPEVVKEYLKAGDESLRNAAGAAAGNAARNAAWDAARAAARAAGAAARAAGAAAWAAARNAAGAAAGNAARAAGAAAWAAARNAAGAAAGATAWDAAWDAAGNAAWDAARAKQNRRFTRLVNAAFNVKGR